MNIISHSDALSISQILKHSWSQYKALIRPIIVISLIVYIPINLILYAVPSSETWEDLRTYMRFVEFLENFFGVIASMAIAVLVKNHLDGIIVTPFSALSRSLTRWLPAIWTGLIAGIFTLGLILLLVIPAIIYGGYWTFMVYCVILANKSGMSALKYSKSIVQGRWWKVFWYNFIFILLSLLVGSVFGITSLFLDDHLITGIVLNTASDIVLAYFSVVSTLFFLTFEATRKELNQQIPVPVPQNP